MLISYFCIGISYISINGEACRDGDCFKHGLRFSTSFPVNPIYYNGSTILGAEFQLLLSPFHFRATRRDRVHGHPLVAVEHYLETELVCTSSHYFCFRGSRKTSDILEKVYYFSSSNLLTFFM